jgi:hypothetical protein
MVTIALIGCSKTKAVTQQHKLIAARDLYISDLFRKRVEHVEKRGLPWYILSAKSGLLKPTVLVRSYDRTLGDSDELELAEWHLGVAGQFMSELCYEFGSPKLSSVAVEMHAGEGYCEPLGAILKMFGVKVIKPVAGRGIGEQLKFYKSA